MKQELKLRLVHSGAPPGIASNEQFEFGLQNKAGDVLAGTPSAEGLVFDFSVEVKPAEASGTDFGGQWVHGTRGSRFLYLSWKRQAGSDTLWGWRIKIPLATIPLEMITAALDSGSRLGADVTHRKPHASAPVDWQVLALT